MKIFALAILLFSCSGELATSDSDPTTADGKEKVVLNGLDVEHPNKKQFEYFLNNYNEAFVPCDSNPTTIDGWDKIIAQFCFVTKESNVKVELFFANHQNDFTPFADSVFKDQRWGANGGGMFVASGEDEYEVADVLGWFAGEE